MKKEEILSALKLFNKKNSPYLGGYRDASHVDLESVLASDAWVVGGRCGGSCWGGVADRPVSSEPEKEIEVLDKFLEENFPSISFLTYRRILKKLQYEEYSCSEYYGNYTESRFAFISIDDIAEVLAQGESAVD